jgi:hypothetical protein
MEPGSAITIRDVADLLFAARERIDFYWNFHVVVVIAVIGWLLSLKRALTVPMKVLFSVVYSVAAAMNFLGLHSSYTFAEALRTDLLRMAAGAPLSDTLRVLERHSYVAHGLAALGVHLAIGLPILLVAWFGRLAHADPATTTDSPGGKSTDEEQHAA